MKDLYIGIEIGATKQQIALGDDEGHLLQVWRDKTPLKEGASDVLTYLCQKVPEAIQMAEHINGCVRAIGIGFGGPLESAAGRVLLSVQVKGWNDFEIKDWFEKQFGLPVLVKNDTVCGGFGELIAGSGVHSRHFFYSNIGSGIGGAFFIDRMNYDGLGRGAAYLGHTYVYDWASEKQYGIEKTENMCSGWAIERRLRQNGYVPSNSVLMLLCGGDVALLDCRMLGKAAKAGDLFALAEIDRVAFSYSVALSNLITLLAPDTVAIGGGVANLGDLLIGKIVRYTEDLVFITAKGSYRIVPCHFIEDAVLVGAVLYASQTRYNVLGGKQNDIA